jgi:hypothetical protein
LLDRIGESKNKNRGIKNWERREKREERRLPAKCEIYNQTQAASTNTLVKTETNTHPPKTGEKTVKSK